MGSPLIQLDPTFSRQCTSSNQMEASRVERTQRALKEDCDGSGSRTGCRTSWRCLRQEQGQSVERRPVPSGLPCAFHDRLIFQFCVLTLISCFPHYCGPANTLLLIENNFPHTLLEKTKDELWQTNLLDRIWLWNIFS